MQKKSLKERLKQDLVVILAVMLFAGGSLAMFSGNPMFFPLVALFLLATFGPYAWEFIIERGRKMDGKPKKIVITGIAGKDGEKRIFSEWKK